MKKLIYGLFLILTLFSGYILTVSSSSLKPDQAWNYLLKTGQTTQYSGKADDGFYQKGVAKSYTVLTTGTFTNIDLPHLISTQLHFDAATNTVTQEGAGGGCNAFLAGGGDRIVVNGSTSNNGAYNTVSATANSVVIKENFANEIGGANTSISKREAHSNDVVIDNNTRLMWSRYAAANMGIGGDGKMPWVLAGVIYDIFAYANAANIAKLAGYNDWRIPNDVSLASLRVMETPSAAPNAIVFPGWPTAAFMKTSTTRPDLTTSSIVAYFGSGYLYTDLKSNVGYVALVRQN